MRRADRLFEIVQILRRVRAPISGQRIANELEVSKRTVYRDMAALIAQRVPVTGEPGVGYVLDDQFDMPPLMLTSDEVEAAVLGAYWVSTRGEPELARAAANLIAKIDAMLPADLRPYILHQAISVAPVDHPKHERIRSAELRAAIRSGHKIAIVYQPPGAEKTERIVWPVLLGYRDEGRILAAWCELRADFRYFRTERIVEAQVLDERFPMRPATLKARWQVAMAAERLRYAST